MTFETTASPPNFLMIVLAGSIGGQFLIFRSPSQVRFLIIEIVCLSDLQKDRRMDSQIIARTLKKRSLQKSGLAEVLGISGSGISALLKGERQIKAYEIPKIKKYLGLDSVPIMGVVGGGGVVRFFEPAPLKPRAAPALEEITELTVALEIQGGAMGSEYANWLLYFDDDRTIRPNDAFDELCVVGLSDGQILVRRVQSSRSKRLFHLSSTVGGNTVDTPIEWASKVLGMRSQ